MPRDFRARLDDMAEAIERIETYIGGLSFDQFRADQKTVDAVVRNLEVIGEAVKGLPTEIRERRPEIPWPRIAGLRDLLIHEYFGVDLDILWDIASVKVPELRRATLDLRTRHDGETQPTKGT